MKFSGIVGNEELTSDPNHRLDTGIVFRIRHYWEIRKVVIIGYKSAAHTDSPDGGTGKTCLDGSMNCPKASSFFIPYLSAVSHHDVGQTLRNACYCGITFLVR